MDSETKIPLKQTPFKIRKSFRQKKKAATAKQLCVSSISTSDGEKKAFEWAMAFGSCAGWNAFFSLPPTPLLRSVCLFFRFSSFSLPLFSIIFCFEFKLWHPCLPQDVCHKLQSNVVTMFFFLLPVPLYDLVFSFLSFFLFFPSRSGAPDVKQPRYGFVLFFLLFF